MYDWLEHLDECPSTNTWAIAHAEKLTHGSVVFTPRQTAGRGQHGRVWIAPEGVLTASFIVDRIPPQHLPGFSLAVGLAVIAAIEKLVPSLRLELKWPNDVLIESRKLAGILCETSSGLPGRVVVGIGLNRCADLHLDGALSLHQVTSAVPEAMVLLEHLRHQLLQVSAIAAESGLSSLLADLRSRDFLYDRTLTLTLGDELITGRSLGVDAQGRLQLQLPDQSIRAFSAGHIKNFDR
jgi:BirA family biotin operon repressor/biotin-[acetyl-CoA-carboxylase] ligase